MLVSTIVVAAAGAPSRRVIPVVSSVRLAGDRSRRRQSTRTFGERATRRARRLVRRLPVCRSGDRDEALKVFLQNLLDSMLIAFNWGFTPLLVGSRGLIGRLSLSRRRLAGISGSYLWLERAA
jgi:hypothetical protein